MKSSVPHPASMSWVSLHHLILPYPLVHISLLLIHHHLVWSIQLMLILLLHLSITHHHHIMILRHQAVKRTLRQLGLMWLMLIHFPRPVREAIGMFLLHLEWKGPCLLHQKNRWTTANKVLNSQSLRSRRTNMKHSRSFNWLALMRRMRIESPVH